jgi:hypothetical protein
MGVYFCDDVCEYIVMLGCEYLQLGIYKTNSIRLVLASIYFFKVCLEILQKSNDQN